MTIADLSHSPADCNRRPTRQPERNSPTALGLDDEISTWGGRACPCRAHTLLNSHQFLPTITHRQVGQQPGRYPTTAETSPLVMDRGAPVSLNPIKPANHPQPRNRAPPSSSAWTPPRLPVATYAAGAPYTSATSLAGTPSPRSPRLFLPSSAGEL